MPGGLFDLKLIPELFGFTFEITISRLHTWSDVVISHTPFCDARCKLWSCKASNKKLMFLIHCTKYRTANATAQRNFLLIVCRPVERVCLNTANHRKSSEF